MWYGRIKAAVAFFLLPVIVARTYQVTARYPNPVKIPALALRGDQCGLSWDSGTPMAQTDNSTWFVALECPDDMASFEMKVLIADRTWMLGGNHRGNINASATTLYPWFFTYQGSLETTRNVWSPELNNSRDVVYYMPPSFYENTLKVHVNVLVMHDGQNLFEANTAFMGNAWYCQNTLDATIIGGSTDEVLIVGPYNTADRNDEYTYVYDPSEGFGGLGDLYLDWIESTLLPFTTSRYANRVAIERPTLGILGSSLGGLISCYAAWTRPQVYGKAGCMSSSFWWDSNDFQTNVVPNTTALVASGFSKPQIYLDSGTGSVGEVECTAYTLNVFDQLVNNDGFVEGSDVWRYVDPGAQHSESYWGPRFHIPMEDLYPASTI
jgi:predicted alpha/beta superfamily hydrolase